MTRKLVDRSVLILMIVGAVLLFNSTASYTGIAVSTSAKYVQFLAVSIGLLCTVQLGFSISRDKGQERLVLTDHFPRFLSLIVGLILFAITFEHVGFFVAAGIFIPIISVALGYRRYVTIGLTTLGVLLFVYLVFIQLLAVNLPTGGS
ncbi:tripartite tricarboxylate transporter TctB family protein [Cohaesibacter intestini]|uniref:tripartite tricarboxylate transporter TctB family protein n=1 Tax=Cohaesibacter intestini TaxID=2211145 RepID=UPI000DEB02E1|nr:tripartite tricarboxylate transporter TctB family protein [Cohaesibacter intestini]